MHHQVLPTSTLRGTLACWAEESLKGKSNGDLISVPAALWGRLLSAVSGNCPPPSPPHPNTTFAVSKHKKYFFCFCKRSPNPWVIWMFRFTKTNQVCNSLLQQILCNLDLINCSKTQLFVSGMHLVVSLLSGSAGTWSWKERGCVQAGLAVATATYSSIIDTLLNFYMGFSFFYSTKRTGLRGLITAVGPRVDF